MFQYFAHTSSGGFFDVDSYSTAVYNAQLIPYYNSPAFGTFSLRDSIDFRPTRQLGSVSSVLNFTTNGLELPNPDSVFTLSYSFYLPRIDKLVLNRGGVFEVIEGISSQYPVAPADARDAMTLYVLSVPAFTANVQQIALQYVENKRYTMADIGTLDARITQLEYLSTLSALEQQATSETILYQDGITAKNQYGVIADDFGDFSVVDNQTTDLTCYLQQGTLSPFKATKALALNYQSNTTSVQQNDRTYTLPFYEVPAVVQNNASTSVTVQPYLFAQFTGTVKLKPETDYWFSSTLSPAIIAPPTANPALPPLPKPNEAPALEPAANVALPSPPVIASTRVEIADYWYEPKIYWYDVAAGYTYVEIGIGPVSYGVISPVTNWFGTPIAAAATPSSNPTSIPQTGSSIQLPSGSSVINSTTISPSSLKVL
jgi:hypothetical protein